MIAHIKENTVPRFIAGKTHRSMRIVRPVDINGLIDDINVELNTLLGNISANTSAISTISSEYTYAEATMIAPQILGADPSGTGAFELLPDPGDGSYYVFSEIIVEYTHVSTNYSGSAGGYLELQQGGYPIAFLDKAMFESIGADNYAVLVSGSSNSVALPNAQAGFVAGAISIIHTDIAGWSAGDGNLLFKFKYKLVTPGTEL